MLRAKAAVFTQNRIHGGWKQNQCVALEAFNTCSSNELIILKSLTLMFIISNQAAAPSLGTSAAGAGATPPVVGLKI